MERHIQALKKSNCQCRLVYSTKLSFLIEEKQKPSTQGKTKGIHDYQASPAEDTSRRFTHRRNNSETGRFQKE
jgi:hypothetical protein